MPNYNYLKPGVRPDATLKERAAWFKAFENLGATVKDLNSLTVITMPPLECTQKVEDEDSNPKS